MAGYFQLLYIRLIRTLKDFGINPYLGIIFGALIFILLSISLFKRVAYFQYVYSVVALIAGLPLGKAQRNEFLKNIYTTGNYQKLRLLENLAVALPFVLLLISKSFYACALTTICFSSLVSLYNKIGRSTVVIPSPFFKRPFEFTIGFRKYYWILIIIYTVTLIALSVGNFNLAIFAYLSILLVCMSFYSGAEPLFYVWIHAQNSKVFLNNKIKTAMQYSVFISFPVGVLLISFFPFRALIILPITLCGLLYVLLGVIAKYTNYPNQTSLLQILTMAIGMTFPPFLLLLIPYFYIKSTKKLNDYLK
jgi:hypothetical protein